VLDIVPHLWYNVYIMEILKEITQWDTDYRQPNHTYLVNKKGQVVAYAKWHTNDVIVFNSRKVLDKRYRKFVKDSHKGLSKLIKQFQSEDNIEKTKKEKIAKSDNVRLFKVKSNDREYDVQYNISGKFLTCSCVGFGYRRKCKHVDAVSKKMGV
jgi:hypothetical protein